VKLSHLLTFRQSSAASLCFVTLFLSACSEAQEAAESSAYSGKGFFRRAVLFATSPKDDAKSRCWYGATVGSYRTREFAIKEAISLHPRAISDEALRAGAGEFEIDSKIRQYISAAYCISAVAGSMGLAAPICILGIANSWQAWGEMDAVEKSQKNLNGSAAGKVIDWPYDTIVGLSKIIESRGSDLKDNGAYCADTPPQAVVSVLVGKSTTTAAKSPSTGSNSSAAAAGVCSQYRVKSGVVAKMWTGASGSSHKDFGVGGQAKISLAQDKSAVGNSQRIWGKVLGGSQMGASAWFARSDLDCIE
jgi:hypothetical protein